MTDTNSIEREIEAVWQSFADEYSISEPRTNVKARLEQVERETAADAREYLFLWIALFDEALYSLLALNDFTGELPNGEIVSTRVFELFLARVCVLMVAVRKLVVSGLEDVARIVVRSLLEALDLAITSLADDEFAERYSSAVEDEKYDANDFWKKNIGYKKLNTRVRKVLESTGLTDQQVEWFFENRRLTKEHFSGSVHSSAATSAIFSTGVPSLAEPGMFSTSMLGHISIHSPDLLSFVIEEIHRFGVVFFTWSPQIILLRYSRTRTLLRAT